MKLSRPINPFHLFHSTAGYTLIELMVTVTIMMMLVGSGLAAYIRLNNRSLLFNSGHNLQQLLRTAQKSARVGEKPTGCTHLLSYEVKIEAGNLTAAKLIAECDSGPYELTSGNVQFDTGVISSAALDLHFAVLQGGVKSTVGALPLTVELHRNNWGVNQKIDFTVDAGGGISDVTLQ